LEQALNNDKIPKKKSVPSSSPLKKIILDTLFPINCFSCGAADHWFCPDCLSRVKILEQQFCPWCEKIEIPEGRLCASCKEKRESPLDGLLQSVSYENPPIKKMIFALKYRFIRELSFPLADIIMRAALQNDIPIPDCIVPIPLHPRRLRWRGFNQAELLAEKFSEELVPFFKIKVLDILERKKHKKPQMEIKKYRDRLESVNGIFSLKAGSPSLKNKRILLIDDIATTGATLQECARVLKENGAKKVFAVVISRQSFKKHILTGNTN
jgi:ComF family protein